MSRRFTSQLSLRIRGPFVSSGLTTAAFGIDTSQLRDGDGRVIVPGTLVAGVIRSILEAMAAAVGPDQEHALQQTLASFGVESSKGSYQPQRRRIRFDDLTLQGAPEGRTITRIKVDEYTGSVEKGMLQVVESPLAFGEPGEFVGRITFDLSEAEASGAHTWIARALNFVPAIGGIKGAGFGRIAGFKLHGPEAVPSAVVDQSVVGAEGAAGHTFRYELTFDKPFLVASETINGNVFKGSPIIPGAAIKGALADELASRGLLDEAHADALDQMVFRHAAPSPADRVRPRAIPMSVYLSDGKPYDALLVDPASEGAEGRYVEFQNDWKGSNAAANEIRKDHGQTFEPVYDIRTRTAISPSGTAEDAKLFTYMSIVPGKTIWIGEIFAGTADQRAVEAILKVVGEGLNGLGKTRANATVACAAGTPRTVVAELGGHGRERWRILLETDAALHGPVVSSAALDAHYLDYFLNAISVRGGPALTPEHVKLRFFARQRWVGGYQVQRFSLTTAPYYPQLVTCAGSVFQLEVPEGCVGAMQALSDYGLPLHASVPPANRQYLRSAFNPENGYGEVTITPLRANGEA